MANKIRRKLKKVKAFKHYDEIIQEIRAYKVVSFDLFDTLIKRDASRPTDVFEFLGESKDGFKENRISAEKNVRSICAYNEISLEEIYKYLPLEDSLKEIELEEKLCFPNLSIKPVYDFCVKNGIKVIITTDIYLDKTVIEKIVKKCGYTQYYQLFVSSEFRCMKADGSLFEIVLKNLDINANELVHIGDNINSDYWMPRSKGIKSVLISNDIVKMHYSKTKGNASYDYWNAFTKNHLCALNYHYNTGFECFGPLLYGFTNWLVKNLEKEGIKKVYFLSRDGEIIKRVFDSVYVGDIESHYLYVSRKALLVPSLKLYKNHKHFINRYHFPFRFSADKLCKMLGCEDDNCIQEIVSRTKTENVVFFRDELENNLQFENVYNLTIEMCKEKINTQYDLVKEYLAQENFYGKVAVVDIGWHGNMQKNLNSLVNSYDKPTKIAGYYIAMTPSEELRSRDDMHGYLFDANHDQQLNKLEQFITSPFELLFTASHGTVIGYKKQYASVVPYFGKFEIDETNYCNIIKNYQKGAEDFCDVANKFAISELINRAYIVDVLFNQFLSPSIKDAIEWGNITHEDNGTKYLVDYKDKKYYLLHPAAVLKDYRNSLWKVGFMKRLLVARLPYYKLILFLQVNKQK